MRLLEPAHSQSFRIFKGLLRRMQAPQPVNEAEAASNVSLRMCQRLYGNARSFDALPFARANLVLASYTNDQALVRRAHTACGLLLADTGDIAGAIEHHALALKLAAKADDAVEMSRVWNNIGSTFFATSEFALATACFRRVLTLLHSESAQIFSRYTAYANLANCLFHTGEFKEGYHFAVRAMQEMTPAMAQTDPHNALLLHRNCARLLVALGRLEEAKIQIESMVKIAASTGSPRCNIAAATAQAAYEMAKGHIDLGLTRLDQALVLARSVPATLRDTLACVIRAEEQAGFPAHALMRLQELSDHVYRTAISQMRKHLELGATLDRPNPAGNQPNEQARARLISRLPTPMPPVEWKTMQRLAVGAAFRIDNSGWHGVRVGVLTQALALEYGVPAIQALEYGLAAQLHDIGMASVPEAILMQPRALNRVERDLMEKHTAAGAEILAGDEHPRMLIAHDIVKYHHARWDGEGYPPNVAGNSIPLAARICAVADVYDALVTDRPYRKAWAMDRALAELQRVAGTQLDPDLVRHFETVIRRETENEGIDPSLAGGLDNFQQLISALTEDRGFL